jgi:SSS family solute:Na+ symporter
MAHLSIYVLFAYLAVVLYLGIFAFRRRASGEDFFLASRSVGSIFFFLSLFATNMTAFAILGSSGIAFRRGIGIFGLMASSSGLVIPLTLLIIGTRLWALGKRFGHMTQVQFFRDRWECSAIGTFIFLLTAFMLIPYLIISIVGGGTILESLTNGSIPYWMGGAIVALVVMGNVFFGGMRGAVWVNALQTLLFLSFGVVAFVLISRSLSGGLSGAVAKLADPHNPNYWALTRKRIPPLEFLSYLFIPLSSIMFPHMAIMCMTAKKVTAFKKTVVLYPLCIMLLWLPCVFLGAIAVGQPKIAAALVGHSPDSVLLVMLKTYIPPLLLGVLAAGIISAVMGSDCHQILALSTMFTKDIFDYYGGRRRFGDRGSVMVGRCFIIVANLVAYLIALRKPAIFELAVTYAFSGFAALAPVMVAALFWKRSTKWGALAAALLVAAGIGATQYLETHFASHAAGAPREVLIWAPGSTKVLWLSVGGKLFVLGFMPVVPMVLGSTLCVILFSLLTRPPGVQTLDRYFPRTQAAFVPG